MASFKQIELLGTKSLSNCDSIVLYNSLSFGKSNIVSSLGLSEQTAQFLSADPKPETIQDIRTLLKVHPEYDPIEGDSEGVFEFDNNKLNAVSGEGFDTMIFLYNDEVLGYIVLSSPIGCLINNSSSSKYTLKRNYRLKKIYITVSSDGSRIKVDSDIINLLGAVKTIAQSEDRDYSGDENHNYVTKEEVTSHPKNSNYATNVLVLMKETLPRTIFQDTMMCHHRYGNMTLSKLNIKKNVVLDSAYYSFKHCQVGYYRGDIVLFIWDDLLRYSILSLTKSVDFGNSGISNLKAYTMNADSNTYIFTIPQLFEDYPQELQKIKYFAGKYVVVEVNGEDYIFDIDRQDSKKPYSSNPGWITYSDPDNDEKLPLSNFVVDRMDPFGKLWRPVDGGSWLWKDYQQLVANLSFVSENFIDSSVAIISSGKYKIGKIGDWNIFSNEDCKVFSNMTKSLTMSIDEEDPIIINDQTLITREPGTDDLGRSTITYTLYNRSGYFMTRRYKERYNLEKDSESRGHKYEEADDSVTIVTSSLDTNPASSPIILQRSLFAVYRRNVLPLTMEGFEIIGSFKGIIFYRIGNTINYI